ncbi:MAG: VWA domain-containing protein [candidate division FCPU426 bacterium]
MTFGQPWLLLALLLLPAAWWLRRQGWGEPAAVDYPEAASVRGAFRGGRRPGSGWAETLRVAGLILILLAVAQPQWLHSTQQQQAIGLDLLLALDLSGSMSARDFEPQNRLQAAKDEARAFIARQRNNRLGLVAFAAHAFTVCPLTLDYGALLTLMEHLSIGMTTDGTALGMAIATCVNRLKDSEAPSKVVVLLTDGRNNAGRIDPLTAAELAAALKIRIYTIGMGQPEGGPILLKNAAGEETAMLNPDGSVHLEAMDEPTLQRIARLTGGKYFRATDRNKLRDIYAEIQALEKSRLLSKRYTAREDLGGWLLLVAMLILLTETAVSQWWQPRVP